MKYSLVLLLLLSSAAISAQLVDASRELICPDHDPTNCYPKILVPSEEWQEVREGQHIPPGLHVRINLETGKEEAKLDTDSELKPELVAVGEPQDVVDDAKDLKDQIQDTIAKYKREKSLFLRSRVSQSDLSDFSSAVDEVLSFENGGDVVRLEKALDTLSELSHDIKFGVDLTKDPGIFSALQHEVKLGELEEKAYRIMGSALRNNPEAVSNVLQLQPKLFFTDLLRVLQAPETSDVIQKRVLGVIQALAANEKFAYEFLNLENARFSHGLDQLLGFFPRAGRPAKERIITILEDLSIIKEAGTSHYDVRSLQLSVQPEFKVSQLLQEILVEGRSNSEKQLQTHFNALVDLHKEKDLVTSKEFLQWLSEETELRKNGERKRDHVYSGEDSQFDKIMLESRHAVFGNPNAQRKAMVDEL